MTVKELREILEKLPPDYDIICYDSDDGESYFGKDSILLSQGREMIMFNATIYMLPAKGDWEAL